MTEGSAPLASGASFPEHTVITFVASVTSSGTPVTQGQVMLCDASAILCSDIHQHGLAQLTSAGLAKFRFVPGPGSHGYKAIFVGTPNASPAFSPSSSETLKLSVSPSNAGMAATTTTMTVSQSGADAFGLTATVNSVVSSPGVPAITGIVSFRDTIGTLLGSMAVAGQTSSVSFTDGAGAPLTVGATVVAEADLNGDGLADVVVGNFNNGAVLLDVLLGKGDGSFAPAASLPASGHYTTGIAVGDYNGDGIPDLAVANITDYNVTILLGNGDGTFAVSPHAIQYTAQSIVTGDFNGDGVADLAMAGGYSVSVYLGKGDGTFTAAGKNAWPNVNPLYLAAGDFNGDGLTDIAVTDSAVRGSAFVLLSNGDGSFRKTALTPSTGGVVESVTTGDFNGDGHLDLALAADQAILLLGKGDGTFQAPKTMSYVGGRSIVVADFNGDGIPDLASASDGGSAVGVLLGNGDGSFREGTNGTTGGGYPNGYIAAADFNGDGIADLAIPDGAHVDVSLTQQTRSASAELNDLQFTPAGIHTLAADYSGDSVYQASASESTTIDALLIPRMIVTPSKTQLATPAEIDVTVTVSGVNGYPAPTGIVTLSTPVYRSLSEPVNQGSASFQLPSLAFAAGSNPITASYQPDLQSDTIYQWEISSATVEVLNPGPAQAPMFSPAAGTYSSGQLITLLDTTPSASIYYTIDGSDPSISSTLFTHWITVSATTTIKAIAVANGYTSSPIAAALYTIQPPAQPSLPSLDGLAPAFIGAGGASFTLKVNGSGFSSSDTVYWDNAPLATQFVSSSQLVAQVPSAEIARAGVDAITVQSSGSEKAASNALQFEIDSAASSSGSTPIFSDNSATVAAGATATYSVALPATVTNVSVACLNLPTGATCTYSATNKAVAVSTASTTPAGTYTPTIVFTETEPVTKAALGELPIFLLPFLCIGRIAKRRRLFTLVIGMFLMILATSMLACGGSSGSPPVGASSADTTQQVTSSAIVRLIVK